MIAPTRAAERLSLPSLRNDNPDAGATDVGGATDRRATWVGVWRLWRLPQLAEREFAWAPGASERGKGFLPQADTRVGTRACRSPGSATLVSDFRSGNAPSKRGAARLSVQHEGPLGMSGQAAVQVRRHPKGGA